MAKTIAALRALIQDTHGYYQRQKYPFSHISQGIPCGAIINISGPGKCETLVQFLAENPSLKVAWIEEKLSAFPCAFPQRNLSLDRIFFSEAGPHTKWSALQILRSGLFQVLVLPSCRLNLKDLRQLQLAAEKAQVTLFLLNNESEVPWPVSMQIQVCRQGLCGKTQTHVLRSRA